MLKTFIFPIEFVILEQLKVMIKYQGISTLEVLIEAKNYNKWIASEILSHISTPVLEVGAGTGNLTAFCLKKKPFYISDKDAGLVHSLKQRFSNEKNIFYNVLDVAKKQKKLVRFFSTIFAINVLEHIKNDEDALKNMNQLLKKGGKLVLLVPAKQFAYSKLDRELGHFRRYEKKELLDKLTNTGYKIEKIYFFNIVGLISWYFRDKVKRNNIHLKPYHIVLFDKIVPFLRFIETRIRPFIGISLIVVAKKI
jgi:SAM-dependent methyltransferase